MEAEKKKERKFRHLWVSELKKVKNRGTTDMMKFDFETNFPIAVQDGKVKKENFVEGVVSAKVNYNPNIDVVTFDSSGVEVKITNPTLKYLRIFLVEYLDDDTERLEVDIGCIQKQYLLHSKDPTCRKDLQKFLKKPFDSSMESKKESFQNDLQRSTLSTNKESEEEEWEKEFRLAVGSNQEIAKELLDILVLKKARLSSKTSNKDKSPAPNLSPPKPRQLIKEEEDEEEKKVPKSPKTQLDRIEKGVEAILTILTKKSASNLLSK